jgi:DNA-binding beta-propeller fold protein YncE
VSLIRLGEPGGTDHRVIGSAPTGLAPVGMALSGDGDLIACANTGAVNAGITGGSVTLIGLGRDGSLTPHGEFNLGAVPAGIGFDKSGRFVCVSQYASQDPEAADGEISFWRLRRGDAPALEQQPFFVGIGAGPHGSLIVR